MVRTFVLALIFLFCGKLRANETGPPEFAGRATGATLDIAAPDYCTIQVYKHRIHHVKTPSYTAKSDCFIDKVVEGDTTICECSPKGAFIKVTHCFIKDLLDLIHVYTIDLNGTKNAQYFYKGGNQWISIEEEEFYDHFNALSITKHEFNDKILDISKASSDLELYVNESPKSPFAVYGTRSTCRVKEIKTKNRGGTTIWKRENDEWCTKLTFYPREGDHKLLWIVTKDPYENENILYYSKMSGSWKSVDKNGYLEDLSKAGFDRSTFDDRVTLDISNVDDQLFFIDKYQVDIVIMNSYHVLPGFRINKVVDSQEIIWESSDDRFSIHLRFNERGPKISLGALFTTNTKKENKIIYYSKLGGKWVTISKDKYEDILAGRDDPMYTHKGDGKIVMSSFNNRQGLRLTSSASKVENAKGDIILVHGVSGSFTVDFCTFDMDWSYEQYGFEIFPYCSIFDDPVTVKKVSNAERYRSYFEYKTLEGIDQLDIVRRSQYKGTFIEALNRLGYNVYGYDHQSHGFSESKTERRCHVEKFMDCIYDLIQFVSIMRRGKFEDPSEKWDEKVVFNSHEAGRKILLLGHSMGGNVVVRAIEEFYKEIKNPKAKFVDGLIVTSGMLNVDSYLDKWYKKVARPILELDACCQPEKKAYFQYPYDIALNFERFADYHTDMLYYSNTFTRNTATSPFSACRKVMDDKRTKFYPKDLPTLFVHISNDNHCDIKGQKKMVNEKLKESKVTKLVELIGCGHHLPASQTVPILVPLLREWLNEYFPEMKGGAKLSQVPSEVQLGERPLQVTQKKLRNVVPKETVKGLEGTTLDISSPDSSLFSLAGDRIHGVNHRAFVPKDGSSIVSVVDNGDTLWTATDTQEGCTGAYLFSREGHSSLLSVYTRGAGDETFCFEKVDGAWKNVDKRYFERKLRSMKDSSAPAGEEHREEDT
ncbi:hypothetical protein BEWA_033800 [Theileria equi strain WA]|uniref:Serine aminopeptidase S33 domain-containing protein n=1 Tax=Theileria equi strain WA TaxID=1537102 RepID=L0AY87_THEEQ|nr:hypothetical protein BEWA_033800 [Theileria equi strain WA]AFZ80525.1 hypothetical protein BEWA_033800 [Theileria equi strain WA]|eukprot:XP_004830191.1 hypothetical protein BEWA_033800 [Theileria equi strain WA]